MKDLPVPSVEGNRTSAGIVPFMFEYSVERGILCWGDSGVGGKMTGLPLPSSPFICVYAAKGSNTILAGYFIKHRVTLLPYTVYMD